MRNLNIPSIPSLHAVMVSLGHLDLRSLTINLLGLTMLALAFITGFPQARHALVNETVAGVSMSGLINGSLSSIAWLTWALGNSLFWIVASCAAGIPALLATWWAVRRSGTPIQRRELFLPALWAAALVGSAALDHWAHLDTMSLVLGTSLLWYLLPAVVEVWRASDVSGVSAASWWLTLTCAFVGATYGVVASVPAEVIYGGLSAVGTVLILVRLAQKSRVWCELCGRANECWCRLEDELLDDASKVWAA
jgi:uncharacterized protein with PQ loop repeat